MPIYRSYGISVPLTSYLKENFERKLLFGGVKRSFSWPQKRKSEIIPYVLPKNDQI